MIKKAKLEELNWSIVRHYINKQEFRTIRNAVTKQHAKEHTRNPESSSYTCKKPFNQRLTQKMGAWYDIALPRR